MENLLKRNVPNFEFEVREDNSLKVTGIAAPFNSDSVDFGYYIERYAPGCFTRTLKDKPDVFALRDHDTGLVVGRTIANDLKLWEDDRGLNYEFQPPDTHMGQDLAKDIRARRITSCSIGFIVREEKWQVTEEKNYIRTLLDVDLWEMSFVAWPAYPDTTAEARGIFEQGLAKLNLDPAALAAASESRKRKLDIIRAKSLL
jgi:HK97 family phage prohead protease